MDDKDIMRRYPRITAHIIAESLGYATPTRAAVILNDTKHRRENWCEWAKSKCLCFSRASTMFPINESSPRDLACYGRDPLKAVQDAIRNRHHHKGYMSEYRHARALVDRAIKDGAEPLLASWF
jgi:hypothetical protein